MTPHHVVLAIEAVDPRPWPVATYDANRIVIRCSCGWVEALGDPVTPARAWRAEQRHLSEAAAADRIPSAGTVVETPVRIVAE